MAIRHLLCWNLHKCSWILNRGFPIIKYQTGSFFCLVFLPSEHITYKLRHYWYWPWLLFLKHVNLLLDVYYKSSLFDFCRNTISLKSLDKVRETWGQCLLDLEYLGYLPLIHNRKIQICWYTKYIYIYEFIGVKSNFIDNGGHFYSWQKIRST